MNEIQTTIEEAAPDQDRQFVIRALVGYNDAQAAPESFQDLTVLSRRDGEIVGGLFGYTHWNWLFIKQLWVAAAFRKRGLGRSLMRSAEQEAHRRGCLHAHCDTFDFQALPFYQKLGYHIFGQLDDYPTDHTRYFLHKRHFHESGQA